MMSITVVLSDGSAVSDSGTIRGTKITAIIKPIQQDANAAAKQQKVRARLDISSATPFIADEKLCLL